MFFVLGFFWGAIGPARKWVLLGNLLQVAGAMSEVAMTWLITQVVLRPDQAGMYLWWMVVALCIRAPLNFCETMTSQGYAKTAVTYVGEVLYRHFMAQDMLQQQQSSASMSRWHAKASRLYVDFEHAEYSSVFILSSILLMFVVVVQESIVVALGLVVWLLIVTLLLWWLAKKRIQRTSEMVAAEDTLDEHIAESFEGAVHVRAYGLSGRWQDVHASLANKYRQALRKLSMQLALVSSGLYLKMDIALLGMSALAIVSFVDVSLETQLFLLLYFLRMTRVIAGFHVNIAQFQRVAEGARLVREVLALEPAVKQTKHPQLTRRSLPSTIELRSVSAKFGEVVVFTGVTVSIQSGVTAVIGQTGSGKSTLTRLIMRALDPESGSVVMNGQDVARLNIEEHRRRLAWVAQEPYVFSGSIRSNLQLLNSNASDAELWSVLKIACLDREVHDLERSLDANARITLTSGGQRQRLEVARVLLADADVVILDEMTSALDQETSREMMAGALQYLREKGRTVVYITHDLRLLEQADGVIEVADKTVRYINT